MSVRSNVGGSDEMVIAIKGRFDFTQVKEFRDAYSEDGNGKCKSYVVDLRDTEHMDSSALGMLLNMRKHLGETTPIRIANSRPQIKKILTISRFDKKFEID